MARDLVRTRRYVQKFYQMRTQLQAVGLRIQTLRSNQQMADAMKGATRVCYTCYPHVRSLTHTLRIDA
jgi:charged multivesicular body protein 2A